MRFERSTALYASWIWLALLWASLLCLPWSSSEAGFVCFDCLASTGAVDSAPALVQGLVYGRLWLLPLAGTAILATRYGLTPQPDRKDAAVLTLSCACGLVWLLIIALSVGLHGWTWALPARLFGDLPRRNPGLGAGSLAYAWACLMLASRGLALRGACRGDGFATASIAAVAAVGGLFVLYPVARLALGAFQTLRGEFALSAFVNRLTNPRIWAGDGIVVSTLKLGLASASSSTLLALSFALLTERSRLPLRRVLRAISILPIITPPFVVGLAVILLLGRNGFVNKGLEWLFGIEPGRWIYGFQGVWFAQTLSFTPIAYLVLVGVVQGVNPSYEEAAQTLRARDWRVFRTVTLPLILPGLANAFLVAFIESLADFGNPLLLGGDVQVLATSIYFSIVGARQDRGGAAVLAMILLAVMLTVFLAQRRILANKSFTTIGGKGQSGVPVPLPKLATWLAGLLALPWGLLTLVIYGMILFGGFVENWGINGTLTLRHYREAFGIGFQDGALTLTGQAWPSLLTTIELAAIAAPLTAGLGLLIAYLLERQRFAGRGVFEFATLIAAGIPGTVLGIGYILAFNNPPVELVETGAIVVVSFVVRNIGPGMRAGMAGLAQIDRALEEASLMLRTGPFGTVLRIVLPLLKPAIVAAMVYGFVSAMTTVSAVIFLVSPGVMLATVYIVSLAEAGTYGMAIAYSSVLIVLMLAVILGIELAVGQRTMRRRTAAPSTEAP